MPGNNRTTAEHHRGYDGLIHPPQPAAAIKPSPKLLSLVLKTLIMFFLTSLFFLFMGVTAIILLHLCVAGRYFHRRRHNRYFPDLNSDSDSANKGYSREDLRELPGFRHVSGTKSQFSTSECVVCLESLQEGDLCRCLPGCCHVFHSNCIDSWLVKMADCPLCRAPVRLNMVN